MTAISAGRAVAAIAIAVLAAACSSGSSAGSGPDTTSPTSNDTSTGTSGSAAPGNTSTGGDGLIDTTAVNRSLADVLSGLTTLTSVPSSGGAAATEAALRTAATKLTAAGQALTPTPEGVPASVATPVSTALVQIANLMTTAAGCLATQSAAAHPAPASCATPLRRADKATGALARDLISLAAYGSEPPNTFESQLVAALRGK